MTLKFRNILYIFTLAFCLLSCNQDKQTSLPLADAEFVNFDLEMANKLSRLAFKCIDTEYPNKLGQVLGGDEDLKSPKVLRPAFYGCFDWHSAVHGHWTLVTLLKTFPNLANADSIRAKINKNLTPENIATEISFWQGPHNKSFERTYGWAWLLKLQATLYSWDDADAKRWHTVLEPLAEMLKDKYFDFLPKLNYPIRVGEHSNTAFGMTLAMDYARIEKKDSFAIFLEEKSLEYYSSDQDCPLSWEPSGYDFLSPCIEEAHMMSKVMDEQGFKDWWNKFLGKKVIINLEPATSLDLTDGKLVHLVGLNFSRAWCLHDIGIKLGDQDIIAVAEKHISSSIDDVVNGDYAGEHWLASFAVLAMTSRAQ